LLNKWLRNIKDVYRLHKEELDAIKNEEEKTNLLVEFTVKEQVLNLAKTSIIQMAWAQRKAPVIHGCVYGLKNGILKDLITLDHQSEFDPLYHFEFPDDFSED
jgi:carbonic anhydrase